MNGSTKNYWKKCSFRETEENTLSCLENQLIYPHGFFAAWVNEVTSVKFGRSTKEYKEYLINDEKIFLIKGGKSWHIKYISTLEERIASEKALGKEMLERAKASDTPWHIAMATKGINSHEDSISLLQKIKRIAEKRDINSTQVYALRSRDLELRNATIRLILGDDVWLSLEKTLLEYEKTSRLLAYYLAFKGRVDKHDLDKQCHIPTPLPPEVLDQNTHNTMMRTILSGTPKVLVAIADSIESNEEAISLLKQIKIIARKCEVSGVESSALRSIDMVERNTMLEKLLGEEIWEKISNQVIQNDDLSYLLGHYLRNASGNLD